MDESVLRMMAAGAVLLFVLLAVVLVWLWREHRRLKQQFRTLAAQVQRSSDDLVGLCSAAIAVDKRLAASELRLDGLLENVVQMREPPAPMFIDEPDEEQSQGYESAIERIHRGAGVEELVKTCGLTRDEAMLLFRLHGKR
ncbi:MAG: DUF2802 domain-containing protein [Gammaproteobacteria bacterium]